MPRLLFHLLRLLLLTAPTLHISAHPTGFIYASQEQESSSKNSIPVNRKALIVFYVVLGCWGAGLLYIVLRNMWKCVRQECFPQSSSSTNTSILDSPPRGRSTFRLFSRGRHGQAQNQTHNNLANRVPTPAPGSPPGDPLGGQELNILRPHQLRHENRQVSSEVSALSVTSPTVGTYLDTAEKAIAGLRSIRLESIRATSEPVASSSSTDVPKNKSEQLPELILVPSFTAGNVNKVSKPNPLSNITHLKPPKKYPHDFEIREDDTATDNEESVSQEGGPKVYRPAGNNRAEALALNERSGNRASSSATVIRVEQFDIKGKEGLKGSGGEDFRNFSVPMKSSFREKEVRTGAERGRKKMSEEDYEAEMF